MLAPISEPSTSVAALSKRARKKLAKQEARKQRKQEHHEQLHCTMLADAQRLRAELQRRHGAVPDAALCAGLLEYRPVPRAFRLCKPTPLAFLSYAFQVRPAAAGL